MTYNLRTIDGKLLNRQTSKKKAIAQAQAFKFSVAIYQTNNANPDIDERLLQTIFKPKYSEQDYIESGYFEAEEGISHQNYKVVKVRKERQCMGIDANHNIQIGELALRENAIVEDIGFQNCYVCLNCIDQWLDEINEA